MALGAAAANAWKPEAERNMPNHGTRQMMARTRCGLIRRNVCYDKLRMANVPVKPIIHLPSVAGSGHPQRETPRSSAPPGRFMLKPALQMARPGMKPRTSVPSTAGSGPAEGETQMTPAAPDFAS